MSPWRSGSHAVIVLAAGGSRRLGKPKQLLCRNGEPLVQRAVRMAKETQPRRVVVVIGTQASAIEQAIADAIGGADAQIAINPHWAAGRSTSLQCGAHALAGHTGAVLILGCDQPALETSHLHALLAGAASVESGCAATVHGMHLGLPAVITATLLQSAHELEGEQGFGRRLSALPMQAVWRLQEDALHFDIDTPENEQAAIARGLLDAS